MQYDMDECTGLVSCLVSAFICISERNGWVHGCCIEYIAGDCRVVVHAFAFRNEKGGCTGLVSSLVGAFICISLECLLWLFFGSVLGCFFSWMSVGHGCTVLLLDVLLWILERDGWVHNSCVLFDECIDLHRRVKCICVDW